MKRISHQLINVPLDFKVACAIYKLDMQEVLQIFIDHITLYDSICREYNEGFSEATRTVSEYVLAKKTKFSEGKAFLNCRDLAVENVQKIIELAKKQSGKAQSKRKISKIYVNRLFRMMNPVYISSDRIYLDEDNVLLLNPDFCVICELHNCYPKQILENFMGRISLAESIAKKGLKLSVYNLAMDLFMKFTNGFARKSTVILHLTDMEIDFYERMEEIRLEIYIVRSLKERIAILQDFYFSHYQNLNP
ncbi:hypothetical protein [Pedobacter sp. L105]|uniref:hypothetical protein n=1 Tax=Pedobacter sp. L105 TaxID=1641871 RepID=UPI00131D54C9|nr:hypothetical protein [Pedobacter sp. L105]